MLDLEQIVADAQVGGSYDEMMAHLIAADLQDLLAPLKQVVHFWIFKDPGRQAVDVNFNAARPNGTPAIITVSWREALVTGEIGLTVAVHLTENGGSGTIFVQDVSQARGAIEASLNGRRDAIRRFVSRMIEAPLF